MQHIADNGSPLLQFIFGAACPGVMSRGWIPPLVTASCYTICVDFKQVHRIHFSLD